MIIVYAVTALIVSTLFMMFLTSFSTFRKVRRATIAALMQEGAHLNLDEQSFKNLISATTLLALTDLRGPKVKERAKKDKRYQEATEYVRMYYLFQTCRKGEHPSEPLCALSNGTTSLRRFQIYVKMFDK